MRLDGSSYLGENISLLALRLQLTAVTAQLVAVQQQVSALDQQLNAFDRQLLNLPPGILRSAIEQLRAAVLQQRQEAESTVIQLGQRQDDLRRQIYVAENPPPDDDKGKGPPDVPQTTPAADSTSNLVTWGTVALLATALLSTR